MSIVLIRIKPYTFNILVFGSTRNCDLFCRWEIIFIRANEFIQICKNGQFAHALSFLLLYSGGAIPLYLCYLLVFCSLFFKLYSLFISVFLFEQIILFIISHSTAKAMTATSLCNCMLSKMIKLYVNLLCTLYQLQLRACCWLEPDFVNIEKKKAHDSAVVFLVSK